MAALTARCWGGARDSRAAPQQLWIILCVSQGKVVQDRRFYAQKTFRKSESRVVNPSQKRDAFLARESVGRIFERPFLKGHTERKTARWPSGEQAGLGRERSLLRVECSASVTVSFFGSRSRRVGWYARVFAHVLPVRLHRRSAEVRSESRV